MNLLIVESPAKAKTLQGFLGSEFVVAGCAGDKPPEFLVDAGVPPVESLAFDPCTARNPVRVLVVVASHGLITVAHGASVAAAGARAIAPMAAAKPGAGTNPSPSTPAAQTGGGVPPNLSPPGSGRTGAFNEAKRRNGVPVSQQPSAVGPNIDRRGNQVPGAVYEFQVPENGGGTRTVRIRDDASGHDFGPNDIQNRGPHFNDEAGGHYDY